jgi:Raf kinase inhibitor-like YbhB/YbcL family protein
VIFFGKVLFTNHQTVDIKNTTEQKIMKIESDIFANNGQIPALYTCYGEGTQVLLKISAVPRETKSLALIVDDPDAPNGDFVHWIVWNIDPKTFFIGNSNVLAGAVEGYTSLNKPGFVPPCPPSGIHHYNFKLYALDILLSISKSSNKADLIRAMDKHIIDSATLVGLYER